VEANFRLTMGFRKVDGRWRIVHEHHSFPAVLSARSADEAEIAALIERRNQAHQHKDATAIVASYVPGAIRYDLAPPLLHSGMSRLEVEQWLATWDGPVTIDTDELDIAVDGALAVAHGVTRMRGRQGGVDQDLWFRSTIVLKRTDGQWRIVHEHTSVPFYMDGSDRAALDLQPERPTRA
jgi:ketosteroid isomerase-like protein